MDPIIGLLIFLLNVYQLLILIVVLLSWVNPDPYNPIVRFLRQVTDPVLMPFRKLMMPLTMRIRLDLSPILAFLFIGFIIRLLLQIQAGRLTPLAVGGILIESVLWFAGAIFFFLMIFVAIRAVVDATNADRFNPIVRFIVMATDPIVHQFRNFRGRNPRYNFAPVAAAFAFFLAWAVLLSLRRMLGGLW
jgi:YggT family protein